MHPDAGPFDDRKDFTRLVLEGSAYDLGDREVLSSRYLGGSAPRLVTTNPQI